jgi:SRSO17 transposase
LPITEILEENHAQANLKAQSLVVILAIRWEVETFFEYDKDLLGSDHYQVMTARAILRFWTLTACLMCFLEEQRGASQETCGDVRHMIQENHRINLLHWLADQFKSGRSVEQICLPLAL